VDPFTITIEIPQGSRTKYEADHETGRINLDRVLYTVMAYPVNCGYIDDTLGEDGDPLDALLLLPVPVHPGITAQVREVAAFIMSDENGPDAKILTVLAGDPRWEYLQDLADVPRHTLNEIEHFFARYKDLEPGKYTAIEGWQDRSAAERLIEDAYRRYGDGA
jgi:inorganic pyrophosphatase